ASSTIVDYPSDYTSEMDLVVLESLQSVDRVFQSTLGATEGSTMLPSAAAPTAMGFAPLSIDVAGAAQPTFASLMAVGLNGERFVALLLLDAQRVSAETMAYDYNGHHVRSFAPMGVFSLAPGNHKIDAAWYSLMSGVTNSRGLDGLPSSLNAVVF